MSALTSCAHHFLSVLVQNLIIDQILKTSDDFRCSSSNIVGKFPVHINGHDQCKPIHEGEFLTNDMFLFILLKKHNSYHNCYMFR